MNFNYVKIAKNFTKKKDNEEKEKTNKFIRKLEIMIKKSFIENKPKILNNPYINLFSVFNNLSIINTEQKRIVTDIIIFKTKFNIYSEHQLSDINWQNIICAGESVLNCIQSIDYTDVNDLRKYYQTNNALDTINLYIHGLNELDAAKKVKEIYNSIVSHNPYDVLYFQTDDDINFISKFPFKNIKIKLKLYKSPAEIILFEPIDCCCMCYNGIDVYMSPRGHYSLISMINMVGLEVNNEYELYKFYKKGFDILIPELDYNVLNPLIYNNSLCNTSGLNKLLLLLKINDDVLFEFENQMMKPMVINKNEVSDKNENKIVCEEVDMDNLKWVQEPFDKKSENNIYIDINFDDFCKAIINNKVVTVDNINININNKDIHGRLPLHLSIIYNNLEMLKVLIQHSNQIDKISLQLACESGNLEIVKMIYNNNLYTESDNFELQPLFYTIIFGHFDIFQYLCSLSKIKKNITWIKQNNEKCGIFELCWIFKRMRFINHLIKIGFRCEEYNNDQYILNKIIKYEDIDMVNHFINHGHNVNVFSSNESPLACAIKLYLLKSSVRDVNLIATIPNNTNLQKIIKLIIEHNGKIFYDNILKSSLIQPINLINDYDLDLWLIKLMNNLTPYFINYVYYDKKTCTPNTLLDKILVLICNCTDAEKLIKLKKIKIFLLKNDAKRIFELDQYKNDQYMKDHILNAYTNINIESSLTNLDNIQILKQLDKKDEDHYLNIIKKDDIDGLINNNYKNGINLSANYGAPHCLLYFIEYETDSVHKNIYHELVKMYNYEFHDRWMNCCNLLLKIMPYLSDNKNDDGYTPIHLYCKNTSSNYLIMENLLNHGADPNSYNDSGYNCMHTLIKNNGTPNGVLTLYRYDKSLLNNKTLDEQLTPLMISIINNNIESTIYLIKSGCNINLKDIYGNNALHYCGKHLNYTIGKILINKNIKLCENYFSLSPLHYVKQKIILLLNCNEIDINNYYKCIELFKKLSFECHMDNILTVQSYEFIIKNKNKK
jgi:ankyrin repeat protein